VINVSLNFLAAGWLSNSNRYEVQAEVMDASRKRRITIYGKWNEYLNAIKYDDKGQKKEYQLWRLNNELKKPVSGFLGTKYKLSKFVIDELLKLDPEYEAILLPSDARLRTDRKFLEQSESKKAGEEKHRLEEKQRSERKEREKNNITYSPKYFKKVEDETGPRWDYCGNYWEERSERVKNVKETKHTSGDHTK